MALNVVTKLRDLSANPDNRAAIARDGCLPGLVTMLSHTDDQVVLLCCEVLLNLSKHPGNRSLLASEPNLIPSLKKLFFLKNENIKQIAVNAYSNLQDHVKTVSSASTKSSEHKSDGVNNNKYQQGNPSTKRGKPNVHVMYVKGLTSQDQKKEIEEALLLVKGVVSIMIDLCTQKVVARAFVPIESLVEAIQKKGFKVSFDEDNTQSTIGSTSTGLSEPDYLPEDSSKINSNAVVALETSQKGGDSNSNSQSGWFSRIGKALWGY